jgi:hypothetical protein
MPSDASAHPVHPPAWHPRTTGGLRDAAHAEAFHAARRRYWAAGGPPRCGAMTKHGEPCRATVRRLGDRCPCHGTPSAQRSRRQRLLSGDAAMLSPQRLHRRLVRAAASRLGLAWKRDAWAPGLTLDLGQHEHQFRAALAAAGWPIASVPYAAADWARWKFRRAFLDGRRLSDIWRDALAALPARIAKAGSPPAGRAWTEPAAPGGLAYTLPVRLPAGSKRRLPDPVRVPREPAAPASLDTDETERAVLALREHAETLAPALALARSEDAQVRLALAFARLSAGEIDHAAWLDALDEART